MTGPRLPKGPGLSVLEQDAEQSESLNADPLLTVSEIADILRCDATTIRRWIKNGILNAVSLPHANLRQSYRVKRSTLDKLLASNS